MDRIDLGEMRIRSLRHRMYRFSDRSYLTDLPLMLLILNIIIGGIGITGSLDG